MLALNLAAVVAGRPRTGRQEAGCCSLVAKHRELSTGSRFPSPWQLLGGGSRIPQNSGESIWGREEQESEP